MSISHFNCPPLVSVKLDRVLKNRHMLVTGRGRIITHVYLTFNMRAIGKEFQKLLSTTPAAGAGCLVLVAIKLLRRRSGVERSCSYY